MTLPNEKSFSDRHRARYIICLRIIVALCGFELEKEHAPIQTAHFLSS
jgi:hypothetical protein